MSFTCCAFCFMNLLRYRYVFLFCFDSFLPQRLLRVLQISFALSHSPLPFQLLPLLLPCGVNAGDFPTCIRVFSDFSCLQPIPGSTAQFKTGSLAGRCEQLHRCLHRGCTRCCSNCMLRGCPFARAQPVACASLMSQRSHLHPMQSSHLVPHTSYLKYHLLGWSQ